LTTSALLAELLCYQNSTTNPLPPPSAAKSHGAAEISLCVSSPTSCNVETQPF